MKNTVPRPTLERLPRYASGLEKLIREGVTTVSAVRLAKALALGEVQVRKELAMVSGAGKPRIGYEANTLLSDIKRFLGEDSPIEAVIIGAGKLGCALLGYRNFEEVGVTINAAFDITEDSSDNSRIHGLDEFIPYCKSHAVKIGIITVPATEAQKVCNLMLDAGIKAIWNFAPTELSVPDSVSVINEKLAISLSQLRQQIN